MNGPMHDERDALDRLLRDARPVAPAGLASRLARGACDGAAVRRVFWLDLESAARRMLPLAAVAAVLAASLVAGDLLSGGGDSMIAESAITSHDELADLALSTKAFERDLGGDLAGAPAQTYGGK